jgi:hypothetical protein
VREVNHLVLVRSAATASLINSQTPLAAGHQHQPEFQNATHRLGNGSARFPQQGETGYVWMAVPGSEPLRNRP